MLNQDQINARDHRGRNLLILAGAGAGKTETLTVRAISLALERDASTLALITFIRRAALSLRDRFENTLGREHNAFIGTFHSFGWRLILDFGPKFGIDDRWAIMDQSDSERLMRMSLTTQGLSFRDCISVLSFARNSNSDPNTIIGTPRFANLTNVRHDVIQTIKNYEHKCEQNKRLDFDSILTKAKMILDDPECASVAQKRYATVLVDEYQDTNRLQANLLEKLNTGSNVTVVGDDAQSIYSFRGARIENILEFEKIFDATRVTLQTITDVRSLFLI